jgi:hypothetical protein
LDILLWKQLTSLPAVSDVVQSWVIRAPQPTHHDGVQGVRGEDRFGERREVGGGAKSGAEGGAEGGHRSTVPEKEKRKQEKTQCQKNSKMTNESMTFIHFVLVVSLLCLGLRLTVFPTAAAFFFVAPCGKSGNVFSTIYGWTNHDTWLEWQCCF